MIDGGRLLAIIPARAGSKRLLRKNLRELSGKSLVGWSIEAALSSKYIDDVIVSTDSEEIAKLSTQFGADVPFTRPSEIATDESSTVEVVIHAIEVLGSKGKLYDYVILLQPTSPLRTSTHVDEAVELLLKYQARNIVSVTRVQHPFEWTNVLPKNLSLKRFISENDKNKRSQDFPVRYRLNGAIYIVYVLDLVLERSLLLKDNCYAYEMSPQTSVDIDTIEDLYYASFLQNNR